MAQLILIGPSRRQALIGGRLVREGEMYEGGKIVAVRPSEVVLQSPERGKETLSLYPDVKIKLAKPPVIRKSSPPPQDPERHDSATGNAAKKEKR